MIKSQVSVQAKREVVIGRYIFSATIMAEKAKACFT